MSNYSSVLALLGRILLALIFVLSGQGKIGGFAGTAAAIASKGLPLAEVLAFLTILVELGGGLLLILGGLSSLLDDGWRRSHAESNQFHEKPVDHGRHADGGRVWPWTI